MAHICYKVPMAITQKCDLKRTMAGTMRTIIFQSHQTAKRDHFFKFCSKL